MTTLLFVHGTSVRETAYLETLSKLRDAAAGAHAPWTVRGCFWGAELGVSVVADTTVDEDPAENEDLQSWALLYSDPFYELRLLQLRPRELSVHQFEADFMSDVIEYKPSAETRSLFESAGMATALDDAVATVARSQELRAAATTASAEPLEHRESVARAIIAVAISERLPEGRPTVTGTTRDMLCESIGTDLGAYGLSPASWLKRTAGNLGARALTRWATSRRQRLEDIASTYGGDVLKFLAGPEPFSRYLSASLEAIADDVFLLGHSLGGVICVDTLVRSDHPQVRGLITVGSQAPYLVQIDALRSIKPGSPLPASFPRWLNIVDPRDLLAFPGVELFGDQITDHVVNNGEPFIQSHLAYWDNADVWSAVADFIGHDS